MTAGSQHKAVFAQTEREYRRRLEGFDLDAVARVLGVERAREGVAVPFFGRLFRVGPAGVVGPDGLPPAFAVRVILLQLLLRCPARPPAESMAWAAYRDFPDAAPLVGFFAARVEGALRDAFRGRLPELAAACRRLPGRPEPGQTHDLAWRLEALPHLPLLLLVNDADAELPASCRLLFPRHAGGLLDMECLALIGEALVEELGC
jgi:hypothetical protein